MRLLTLAVLLDGHAAIAGIVALTSVFRKRWLAAETWGTYAVLAGLATPIVCLVTVGLSLVIQGDADPATVLGGSLVGQTSRSGAGGARQEAARRLGMERTTLYRLMKRYGIG